MALHTKKTIVLIVICATLAVLSLLFVASGPAEADFVPRFGPGPGLGPGNGLSNGPGNGPGKASAGDRVMFELALAQYQAMVKNLTLRVEASEHTLQMLREGRSLAMPPSRKPLQQAPVQGGAAEAGPAAATAAAATAAAARITALTEAKAPVVPDGSAATTTTEGDDTEEDNDEAYSAAIDGEDEDSPAVKAEKERLQKTLIGFDEATKFYRRYRGDFKCGDRVPELPDGEAVECDPSSEHPCCSTIGWCGKSNLHCECDGCQDYRFKVRLKVKTIKIWAKNRECDSIAWSFGPQDSARTCADLVLEQVECGHSLMYSQAYPEWGCRCCSSGTGPGSSEKSEWTVWKVEVDSQPVPESEWTKDDANDANV